MPVLGKLVGEELADGEDIVVEPVELVEPRDAVLARGAKALLDLDFACLANAVEEAVAVVLEGAGVGLEAAKPARDVDGARTLDHADRDGLFVADAFEFGNLAEFDGDGAVAGSREDEEVAGEAKVVGFEGLDGLAEALKVAFEGLAGGATLGVLMLPVVVTLLLLVGDGAGEEGGGRGGPGLSRLGEGLVPEGFEVGQVEVAGEQVGGGAEGVCAVCGEEAGEVGEAGVHAPQRGDHVEGLGQPAMDDRELRRPR